MNPEKRDRTIFIGAVILLLYTFVRALMPVNEVPSPRLNVLSIVMELGLFIGVVGMAPRILRSVPKGASRGGWIILLGTGVIAGFGIFALRISGGPRVELPPRTSSTDNSLPHQMHEQLVSLEKVTNKLATDRWFQTFATQDPAKVRTLTRENLEEARALCAEMRDGADRILKVFAEASAMGVAHSTLAEEVAATRPETWRAIRELYSLRYEYDSLIAQHWDDWLAKPFPGSGESDLKPWQIEIQRLTDAAREADARLHATARPASTPATAPSPPGNNFDQLALQTQMQPAVADYVTALNRLQATRWVKSPDANSYHPQKITQADLHDAGDKLREFNASVDKVIANLKLSTVPVPAAEREYWRAKHEISVMFKDLTKLLEDNWKQWHVAGIQPKTGEPKPWQKEALRLQSEIDKLKEMKLSSVLL